MLTKTLQKILQEIQNGTTIPGHPFKFGCLSSIENNVPKQRMVVIRKLANNQLTIYTDKRSPKVTQFNSNPNASILFYDTVQMTQVILKGTITVVDDKNLEIWKRLPEHAHKDYTTLLPPGTPIQNKEAEYNPKAPHFCYLLFNFTQIDYLSIGKPNNTRVRFNFNNSNNWESIYLVP